MELKRVVNNMDVLYKSTMEDTFRSKIPMVKEVIMEGYDELSSFVIDTGSKSDPAQLREQFVLSLDKFEFVKKEGDTIFFEVPDMDTFNFTDLELIEHILEGPVGEFVEVPQEALSKLNIVGNLTPVNSLVEPQDRVYLWESSDELQAIARQVLGYPLVIFPFDTPQYELVFGIANDYVENNIDEWIKGSLAIAQQKISQTYRRI